MILEKLLWPSIYFEGTELPQSLSGISILINSGISEDAGDWIWRICNCKNTWKEGSADWCYKSANEIMYYMISNQSFILDLIKNNLGIHGFNEEITYNEWMLALSKVQKICQPLNKVCRWISECESAQPEEIRSRILGYLDINS